MNYEVLEKFCRTNDQNQKILFGYLDFLIENLDFDFGQIDLINSIFRNNKYLCEKSKNLIPIFAQKIRKYGRKTKFIEFFKVQLHK